MQKNVNKKLVEITKFFQGFRNPKKCGHKHLVKKAPNTSKEFDLDNFETTSKILNPKRTTIF